MSHFYFAYGSNMNAQRMQQRQLSVVSARAGSMSGYRLAFNKRAADRAAMAYANIVVDASERVEGVLYQLASTDEIFKMDPFEGTPRYYSRELFAVETEAGCEQAWVYVANRAMLADDVLPARWYLQHLLAGQAYLTPDYYARLCRVECLASDPLAADSLERSKVDSGE